MMTSDLFGIIQEIQKILEAQPSFKEKQEEYLDISQITRADEEALRTAKGRLPPPDPLVHALAMILETMKNSPFALTRLGINELLKSFLYRVNAENQEACSEKYLSSVYEIFLSMLKDYPFEELLWEYLSQCFDTISKYLIARRLAKGCQVFLDKVALMGKAAAGHGLHTSSIQHFLHNLEVKAREEGFEELADSAKNHRFNLETF